MQLHTHSHSITSDLPLGGTIYGKLAHMPPGKYCGTAFFLLLMVDLMQTFCHLMHDEAATAA